MSEKREKETKNEVAVYDTATTQYSKSNFLISSKYRSTLLENKIMAIALAKVQNFEFTEDPQSLICELKTTELRKLLGTTNGSFYTQLEPLAQNMTARTIGWSNPEQHEFSYMSIISKCMYANGVFTIKFNPELKKYISNLQSNFTILELPVMLKFKSAYSFRLYELLRSRAFLPKYAKSDNPDVYHIFYSLSELKLSIGVVNSELDSVRKILNNSDAPDYDKAVAASPEKLFNTWSDFKKRVLDVAVAEINEKTEIYIEYEPLKTGRGGKVVGVDYYVRFKNTMPVTDEERLDEVIIETDLQTEEPALELDEDAKFDFYMELRSMIREKLSYSDLRAISEAAGFHMDKIEQAYEVMKSYKKPIANVPGFLIEAIKKGYQKNPAKTNQNFAGRDYRKDEMDDISKMLILQHMK